MTVLPRQRLSTNKKLDFSPPDTSERFKTSEDLFDVEDDTIDFSTLDDGDEMPSAAATTTTNISNSNQPLIIHESTPGGGSANNNNNNSHFPTKNTNMFNQKKSQEKDYQEMLIVRQSLDFDERSFRDSYIRTESEIILKMRKDIDALYDWLDKLVAELTKSLNNFQETKKGSIEDKLRKIREHSVRADAINRSIQNFLTSIHHAYQHTFAAFLDNVREKDSSS